MPTPFGQRVGSYDVEQAIITVLHERLPTYVQRCAITRYGTLPANFPIRPAQPPFARKAFRDWPEAHLPCVQVACPGMAAQPERRDEGRYTTWWEVNVFVVVSARDHAATRLVRSVYEDAVGWCLLQRRSLKSVLNPDGFASGMDWLGESSADAPIEDEDERTLQGAVCVLVVEVPNCLDPTAGPVVLIPDTGAPPAVHPDDPLVEDTIVEITPEPLT